MKRVVLTCGLLALWVTSFASGNSINSFEYSLNVSEIEQSCFSQCNNAANTFRDIFGWTAIEFVTFEVDCTNTCEELNGQ